MPTTTLSASRLSRFAAFALLVVALAGCDSAQLPDPNDPKSAGTAQVLVLRRNLAQAYRALDARKTRKEITEDQKRMLLRDYARSAIDELGIHAIPEDQAFDYGEVFRTAERWELAAGAFRVATLRATTEDRRVNGTLRWAEALAHLRRAPLALQTARRTLDAAAHESAPILPAVLYEIAPALRGQRADRQVAELLREAVAKHAAAVVDERTEAGRAFTLARPVHIARAWWRAAEFYAVAGDSAAAEAARATARKLAPDQRLLDFR